MRHVGERVRIRTPDNPRLDGTEATVASLTDWGAHLEAPAAATRAFRAAWSEMEGLEELEPSEPAKPAKREATGDVCSTCGGVNLVRTGSCLTCQDCGNNSGCG